jgi:mono/diheme cytochrome c family protein
VPPPATQQIYRPTISDLMNDAIQPRHTKLWLAGAAGNWTLAEYERHNVNGAFGRIATAVPSVKGAQTADLIATFVAPNLTSLANAIKARDQNAFAAAYAVLTEGCNECHQATGYPMVVIQSPGGNPFPDQDFRPGRSAAPSMK